MSQSLISARGGDAGLSGGVPLTNGTASAHLPGRGVAMPQISAPRKGAVPVWPSAGILNFPPNARIFFRRAAADFQALELPRGSLLSSPIPKVANHQMARRPHSRTLWATAILLIIWPPVCCRAGPCGVVWRGLSCLRFFGSWSVASCVSCCVVCRVACLAVLRVALRRTLRRVVRCVARCVV